MTPVDRWEKMSRALQFHLSEFAEGTTELELELTAADLDIERYEPLEDVLPQGGRDGASIEFEQLVGDEDASRAGAGHRAETANFQVEGPIRIGLRIVRTHEEFRIQGRAEFEVRQSCVRCPAPTRESVEVSFEILVRPRDARAPEDEAPSEGILIHDGESFGLATEVRDAILTEISSHPLCRSDCRGLCPRCGKTLNEGGCDCPATGAVDPRWAALRELRGELPESEEPGSSQA